LFGWFRGTPARPTYPPRACPPFSLWPSRTGLDRKTKSCWRSPGSRACCFSACAASRTMQDRTTTREQCGCRVASLLFGTQSASRSIGFSKAQSPRPTGTSGLRFTRHLTMSHARLEARMEPLFSFPVGLLHPIQHAGLSRRTPGCRPTHEQSFVTRAR
jgi:hypothetical protein